ncbi:hypothetical protein FH972_013193 [Carpinus fangiana]|uniref:Endonuclease/exonuclease/phosphatase domain-containing protein n=1 Tax=Carpinus fangiana TaxID=176857 RepID=A0A5N6R9E2_9ROSI|nr:hypothetical protein FH972_013193 [Carpinus fangiana]
MRRSPLRVLAAASPDVSMSSRPPYRGGRWRGFSDRPYDLGRGQTWNFVTGDSHLRSVHDANLGFRRGDSGGVADRTGGFRPPPLNARPPHYAQNAQFRQPPPYNKNKNNNNNNNNQSQQNRPNRPFDTNPGFRLPQHHRPKPLDYRNWEYATEVPPPNSERFIVLSYNILADYLANDHRNKLYFQIPPYVLDWEWRKRRILFELGLWSADVMCFQEVDRFQELEDELKLRGYSGIWKMRTGMPIDGCAIFWRTSRFKLLHEECIEFNKLGLRDNVAQICVLELNSCTEETAALPISSSGSCKFVICNIHVLYNPKRGEIKLGQIRVLLNRAHSVSKLWDDAPVIVCGDFNCTPKSPLYNFLSERKLDISEIGRDKVSGQASAVIPALRRYNPNPGAGSANNSSSDPSLVDGKEINSSASYSGLPAGHTMHNKIHKYAPVASHPEEVYSDANHTRYSENVNAPAHLSSGSLGGHAKSNDYVENESVNCEDPTISFLGNHDSTMARIDPECGDPFNSEISSSEQSCRTSFSNAGEVFPPGNLGNLSSHQKPNDDVGEKLENLSLNELDKAMAEGGNVGEDSTFLSALHNSGDAFPSDFGQLRSDLAVSDHSKELESISHNSPSSSLNDEVEDDLSPGLDSEPVAMEETAYDPSLWTPMEIETATGNADCNLLEHPLMLSSTYTEVKDCSGTRDSNGEPLVTSYNTCFMGTVDYIWRSEALQTVRVLAPIKKQAMQWTRGFPTKKWGSDHIALVAELALVKGVRNHNTEVK